MSNVIRLPVVVAFLIGVFLTLVVFVTAFVLGEVTATRRGGILVSAAALATRTATPTETPTFTPTPLPTDTPTETPTNTPTAEPTPTPPPPTSKTVPVTPTSTAVVLTCGKPKDVRIGLNGWGWGTQKVPLSRGQSLDATVTVFGGDRSVEVHVVDQNGVELLKRRLAGSDSAKFIAPYDDTFQIKVYNPTLLQRKTVDLRWQVCGG